MKYYVEESLSNFKFWSEAAKRAQQLTQEQFDQLEAIMDDGMTEWTDTSINDLFWFEPDTIAEWLGYKDWEYLEKGVAKQDVEDADKWADDMVRFPIDSELRLMFELTGLAEEDLGEYETDDEKSDAIVEEFEEYWEGLDDVEKVDIYNDYN